MYRNLIKTEDHRTYSISSCLRLRAQPRPKADAGRATRRPYARRDCKKKDPAAWPGLLFG